MGGERRGPIEAVCCALPAEGGAGPDPGRVGLPAILGETSTLVVLRQRIEHPSVLERRQEHSASVVPVIGETGTGNERVKRVLHLGSGQARGAGHPRPPGAGALGWLDLGAGLIRLNPFADGEAASNRAAAEGAGPHPAHGAGHRRTGYAVEYGRYRVGGVTRMVERRHAHHHPISREGQAVDLDAAALARAGGQHPREARRPGRGREGAARGTGASGMVAVPVASPQCVGGRA